LDFKVLKSVYNAQIPNDYIEKIIKNIDHNKLIELYYSFLIKDSPDLEFTLTNKVERLSACNRYWLIDRYDINKVKDFKKTNLCKDKFCNNCKKVKQASRMSRYIPEIEKYRCNLYHLVLTQPNVHGIELKQIISKMAHSFSMLNRYLKGDKKIKGIDFSSWGYLGSVRSLEITFNDDSYHPHYHVGIILENGIGEKIHSNQYSHNRYNPKLKRLFSEKEVLIQKIWYLLMNGEKVTKKAIDELQVGYSCMIDKFKDDDYAELFKYMTKATDEEDLIFSYHNFKTLYFALHRIKQIQGYGVLYRIDDTDLDSEVDKVYIEMLELLQEKENPVETYERPQDLLLDNEYILISRKKIFQYLREIQE